jgi:anaerobic selenocysteine-containing dehydrogenase
VDAERLKQKTAVRVTTESGSIDIGLEIMNMARPGQEVIPHGCGLVYQDKAFGANANRLTKNTHRDQFGTPIQR